MNRDLKWLSEATGIPYGTLRNVITYSQENPTRLARIYLIAGALDLKFSEVAANGDGVTAARGDGVPDNPPKQPKQPTSPPKRQDKEEIKKGPRRAQDEAAA